MSGTTFKIGDYGSSRILDDSGLYTRHGSTYYMPLQMLKVRNNEPAEFTNKCDVYSMGVVFYELFYGIHPFPNKEDAERIKAIAKGPKWHGEKIISLDMKVLLEGMLKPYEKDRWSWQKVFDHNFFLDMNLKEMILDGKEEPLPEVVLKSILNH